MKEKILIKDIASQLNVSITTVSFVINGKAKEKNISDALAKRVLDLVEKLDYQPNALAKSLRTGKTKILGFLVDDISEPFFSGIARFIDEKASEMGYKILFSSTRNDQKKAIELLQIFRDRHVDGYIIALPEGLENEISKLIQTKKPVVLFDRYVPELKTDYVVIDNQGSTYEATQHLIDNGYKNIGFITIDTEQQQMIDRLAGYEQAIKEHNLSLHIKKLNYVNSADSIKQMTHFFSTEEGLDAVIFAANYICMDGLRTFRQMEINILEDLAVVSFDDFELLEFCNPPVTAIAQPLEAIAERIMKTLLSKLNSDKGSSEYTESILPAVLNIRGSSLRKSQTVK
ncbi:LacI family DNA-binding transcriptional regulator [Pedobacter punctiformis]|uniref:LacI family DNA-binding transcriptional regulator n=1 Tax=Pedobacter punctiformis TaxID=3004097 RepID=A0ABT4L4N4_9SPHI|nr:LacI family DNA-binding transcriptional regulator [Pedobacter sp. HCMS5-2]MCZ4242863.1 LacI family DNA-binding transcriptional regulator [Pedobacter sp. HCMS5-2]